MLSLCLSICLSVCPTAIIIQAGSNLGFDLFSSLAAIDAWADDDDDDDDSDTEEGVNGVTLRQCNEDIEGYEAVAEETYASKIGDYDNEGESDSGRGGIKLFHRNSSREEALIVRTGVISTRNTGTYRANFAKDFATKILSKNIIQNMVSSISDFLHYKYFLTPKFYVVCYLTIEFCCKCDNTGWSSDSS